MKLVNQRLAKGGFGRHFANPDMGKQYNKVIKRKRRKAYNERRKERLQETKGKSKA